MKSLSLAVCLAFAASAHAQLPYVKDFGQRKDAPPTFQPNGVYWPDKRVAITVTQFPFAPETYYQPFDFLVPAGSRFDHPRGVWYPVRLNVWTDGRPWVQTWRFASEVEGTYTMIPYPAP